MKRLLMTAALASSLILGCGPDAQAPQDDAVAPGGGGGGKQDAPNAYSPSPSPALCVGVRGNGQRIFAHFGAMTRIHERYGLIEGVAGGSSGSITSFLTESIYANPHVYACQGSAACSDEESGLRAALLFKSLQGYAGLVAQSDEVVAFQQAAPIIAAIKAEGIDTLIEDQKFGQAADALQALFSSPDLRALINPEVLALLKQSPARDFHVKDLWETISSFGSFEVDSQLVLLRPGLLDFSHVARMIGRMANFYAVYGPDEQAAWQALMTGCAAPSRGLSWAQTSALDAGDGSTCGEHFEALVRAHRAAPRDGAQRYPERLDDEVGAYLPALVTTSVITGAAVESFEQARAGYLSGQASSFEVSYEDVKIAYWGQQADLARAARNTQGYTDLKTQKFTALGEATYRTALSYSPAEPGLARALEISEGVVSTGGWSDLEPTLVLKNMGCEQVLLITRQGSTVGFGADVSRQLGMGALEQAQMFEPGVADSSVSVSLAQADGVWCTSWDAESATDFGAVFEDAYTAPLQTGSEYLKRGDDNDVSSLGLTGCTAGVE